MDERDLLDGMTHREVLKLGLPDRLVDAIGPFPDEVGYLHAYARWFCFLLIGAALFEAFIAPIESEDLLLSVVGLWGITFIFWLSELFG